MLEEGKSGTLVRRLKPVGFPSPSFNGFGFIEERK
jgi:hypothetical protein